MPVFWSIFINCIWRSFCLKIIPRKSQYVPYPYLFLRAQLLLPFTDSVTIFKCLQFCKKPGFQASLHLVRALSGIQHKLALPWCTLWKVSRISMDLGVCSMDGVPFDGAVEQPCGNRKSHPLLTKWSTRKVNTNRRWEVRMVRLWATGLLLHPFSPAAWLLFYPIIGPLTAHHNLATSLA